MEVAIKLLQGSAVIYIAFLYSVFLPKIMKIGWHVIVSKLWA